MSEDFFAMSEKVGRHEWNCAQYSEVSISTTAKAQFPGQTGSTQPERTRIEETDICEADDLVRRNMKSPATIAEILAWIGTACWIVCFWWMHRISSRQNALLEELHAVTQRIERLSVSEHDLIKEVHPVIGQIKDSVENVAAAVESS